MNLLPHLRYLKYVLLHKYYVFVECCKVGIPVTGLLHDLSKFSWREWNSYVQHFYGAKNTIEPEGWLYHQHKNKHHWQYWVIVRDSGDLFPLPMPEKYMKEMLADWEAAAKVKNKEGFQSLSCKEWYETHKDKMAPHPNTRRWVEERLRRRCIDIGSIRK